jgi:hypothetical protein
MTTTTTQTGAKTVQDMHRIAGRLIDIPNETGRTGQAIDIGRTTLGIDQKIEIITSIPRKQSGAHIGQAPLQSTQRNWMDGAVLEFVDDGARVKCELFSGPSDKSLYVLLPTQLFEPYKLHYGFPFRLEVVETGGLRRFNVTQRVMQRTPEQEEDLKVLFPDTV